VLTLAVTLSVQGAILGIQVQQRRRLPASAGRRRYPPRMRGARGRDARHSDAAQLVLGIDLWEPLRRAYGVDLANGLTADLARAIAASAAPDVEVRRLPEGRFALRLPAASAQDEGAARALVRRVRAAFAASAALPEGRPTVSAVLVPASGGGEAGATAAAGGAWAGGGLAAVGEAFARRGATEVEWIEVAGPAAAAPPEEARPS
jgi:GGDEF domain-containing protein